MTFSTLTFFIFLALVFSLYWMVRYRSAQNLLLVAASYAFYSWWDWRFCGLMLLSSVTDYLVGIGLGRARRSTSRLMLLILSLVVNLGLLGCFKYFGFFYHSLTVALDSIGWTVTPLSLKIILPVGISFYTFQTLSYTIDVYRGQFEPTRRIVDFFAFVSFFPQLVAGPIERARSLLPQFSQVRSFDRVEAADGCRQILWGLFKKMVLADNLSIIVDAAYQAKDISVVSGPEWSFATICFAFQIYCDFSAYSDIAIGTARLFRIRLSRNFAYPYFSQDPGEFWRRWHISLSTWFRDYVYIPLGGSLTRPLHRAWNVLLTFVISGLWHGPSWNFVIWGAIHGLAVAVVSGHRSGSKRGPDDKPANTPNRFTWVGMFGTFAFVCAAWVFFRARTLGDSFMIFSRIGSDIVNFDSIAAVLGRVLDAEQYLPVLLHLIGFILVEWWQRGRDHALNLTSWPRAARWVIYTALVWDIIYFGTHEQGAFIYFQF